jgi:hypothetical protein
VRVLDLEARRVSTLTLSGVPIPRSAAAALARMPASRGAIRCPISLARSSTRRRPRSSRRARRNCSSSFRCLPARRWPKARRRSSVCCRRRAQCARNSFRPARRRRDRRADRRRGGR